MHFPVIFHIYNFPIPAHIIFETLAFFIGFRFFLYLKKKRGDTIVEANRTWIFIGATAGAVFGSRFLGALEDPAALLRSANPILYIFRTRTIAGGLAGGLLGVELIKKIIGEKRSSGDLFTFPIILGMIIGRIGCFLNGTAESAYGIETSSWFGMNLGDNKLRHPVTLYEIAYLILIWAILLAAEKNQKLKDGIRFQIFMIAYFGFRFCIEFIKPHVNIFLAMSAIQWVAVLILLYYARTLFNLIFRQQNIFFYAEHP